jgi:nucleotide-binding universal stress UspA family protein
LISKDAATNLMPPPHAGIQEQAPMNQDILKFRTIAVATDLSEPASAALRYAQTMARMYPSRLVVIHVTDPLRVATHQAAAAELKKIEQETSALGIPVHSVIERGIVCDRIARVLKDYNADLLILGTRAKSETGRVALGTVARQLLARSRCPILTVSPDAAKSLPWSCCWGRVLAATDFSPASIRALQCAHQVALRQLILLHVPEGERVAESAHCRERLRFLAPLNESHPIPVEHIVQVGNAADLIYQYAEKFAVDLLVLGSPTRELAEEDFHSSTVFQVISKVCCPVLCLPVQSDPLAAKLSPEAAVVAALGCDRLPLFAAGRSRGECGGN